MAGKFTKPAVTTVQDIFYQIYNFIVKSGQTVMEIVSQGGVPAIWNNSADVAIFANAAACVSGSYIVIGPTTANGGVKWQYKIVLVSTTGALTGQLAPDGGWTNASQFGAATVTNATQINDGSNPTTAPLVYIGCNTQSYNSGANTFSYFWTMIKDAGAADQFAYVGGYVPAYPASDTKPVCLLARDPVLTAGNNSVSTILTTSNNLNRAATEYAHSTTWNTNGYASMRPYDGATAAPGANIVNRDLAGNYLSQYLYLYTVSPAGMLGDFAAIMTTAQNGIANFQQNAAATYIKLGDLWVYYNEAL